MSVSRGDSCERLTLSSHDLDTYVSVRGRRLVG